VQNLSFTNVGGGSVGFSSAVAGAPWLSVGNPPGAINGGEQATIPVTVYAGGLAPGYYSSTVRTTTSAGVTVTPVTLYVSPAPAMGLSSTGTQISFPSGGVPAGANSFTVGIASDTAVNWSASVVSGADWLSTSTPSGMASNSTPGKVWFTVDPAKAAALSSGLYTGTIRVTSSQTANSPLDYDVLLNVWPSTAPPAPVVSPDGVVLVTSAIASQNVTVASNGAAAASYQASGWTSDGSNWLTVRPSTDTVAAGATAASQIVVDPAGLPNGPYYGSVSYGFGSSATDSVNVTLIVVPTGSCTAAKTVPARVVMPNGFVSTVGRPTAMGIQLMDDCGQPLTSGWVTASFSNGDTSLSLTPIGNAAGLFTATWYPAHPAGQVSVTFWASSGALAPGSVQSTGIVMPANGPLIAPLSTLHIFAPQPGAALAPGTLVQISGLNLAAKAVNDSSTPQSTSLGNTSVTIGGLAVPLSAVGPAQISAQVPFELAAEGQYEVQVNNNGVLSPPDTIHVSAAAPGVQALSNGLVSAQHMSGGAVSEQAPAAP
ncbi:MAG: hypothetical protein KGN84_05515, partial [Acidobacteriota bacterium]|nr:hypothetical protein [Acidobacteriota bacterium]